MDLADTVRSPFLGVSKKKREERERKERPRDASLAVCFPPRILYCLRTPRSVAVRAPDCDVFREKQKKVEKRGSGGPPGVRALYSRPAVVNILQGGIRNVRSSNLT